MNEKRVYLRQMTSEEDYLRIKFINEKQLSMMMITKLKDVPGIVVMILKKDLLLCSKMHYWIMTCVNSGRPDFIAGNPIFWTKCNLQGQKDRGRSGQDKARKYHFVKEIGTPRTVLFVRGKECNVPLIFPWICCNFGTSIVLILWGGAQGQGPTSKTWHVREVIPWVIDLGN